MTEKVSPLTPEQAINNILNKQNSNNEYNKAFQEIKNGQKINHWIWYIFPTIFTVRSSSQYNVYDLPNFLSAKMYLENSVLHDRLLNITIEVIKQLENNNDPLTLFGSDIDVIKAYITFACFTLVALVNKKKIMFETMENARNLIENYFNKSFYENIKQKINYYKHHSYEVYYQELCLKKYINHNSGLLAL